MKKTAVFLCLLLTLTLLCSCNITNNPNIPDADSDKNKVTEITLWTFPVGNWCNPTSVSSFLAGFHKAHPDIRVSIKYLNYNTGDALIDEAKEQGNLPDLVLEGPERLVANWGVDGLMADLSDLWQSDTAQTIYPNIEKACKTDDGKYYEFPICMTAHCMAINYDMFEQADALKYLDVDENGNYTHTWSTDNFKLAVEALRKTTPVVGEIYCKSQSGDQGTRALVTNLCGGTFTNETHTQYTVDSKKNVDALNILKNLDGIKFNSQATSNDAIDNFCNKDTAMCFCWGAALAVQQIITKRDMDFKIMPMAFPTPQGEPELQGGIWGFGIFDNKDENRVKAAKTFIKYATETSAYSKAVLMSSYWPVRAITNGTTEINIYENDEFMTEYGDLMKYMGDYYQVSVNWQDARTAWWQMLQKIGDEENPTSVEDAIKNFPVVN